MDRILPSQAGTENSPCKNLRCVGINNRVQIKATFFHKPTKSWICLGCAQKINAQAMRNKTPKEAISAQEYLMEVLRA